PWRPVVLERWSRLVVEQARLRARLEAKAGIVTASLRLSSIGADVVSAALCVGETTAPLRVARSGEVIALEGELAISNPELWWPHTHGTPRRYPASVCIELGGRTEQIDLGLVGFRTVRLDTDDKAFTIHVNEVPIFCRGACWTTNDVATLTTTPSEYARVLGSVKAAGMNMLRMSGTLFYEADAFYEACDELGILVWQDFMFANMDYPIADDSLRASVTREARELLGRLEARPCLTMLCGGSEVEQQAAMFGASRELWRSPLFAELLPEVAGAMCPGVPYWPSSPSSHAHDRESDGALPFHVDVGAAHYYGVGAYLRPFDDARRARVKFASECLAFANVPEDDFFPSILADGEAPFVHPRWKERTSKDHGSSWDFEDVRDHYLKVLFGVDPMRLRYQDIHRYLVLSRVTSGEVMARVFAEFRRRDSTCKGALVWFLQDLWPGAGWGILDSRGRLKAPYWFLKRSLQPTHVSITDEGVNGLHLHVSNDSAEVLTATLRFTLYRDGEVVVAEGSRRISVAPRSAIEVAADALLPTFLDTARAYRFGPPGHDLAVASLLEPETNRLLAETTYLQDFASPPPCFGLDAFLMRSADILALTVRSKRFAHAVTVDVPGHVPDDNYFDLPPNGVRTIALRPVTPSTRTPSGEIAALNLRSPVRAVLRDPTP
ncbi:MAG TPA: glycoside hydrolase family 2 protein, partial [Labilithrix sp.]|nr:glycoside hydrolase family 2 protein [Labilithrix sp.]